MLILSSNSGTSLIGRSLNAYQTNNLADRANGFWANIRWLNMTDDPVIVLTNLLTTDEFVVELSWQSKAQATPDKTRDQHLTFF